MLYYNKSVRSVFKELSTSPSGLHESEIQERQKMYGLNAVHVSGEPLWRKLLEPFANVFMGVLFLAALISILHHDTLDAIIIGVIMAASAAIYYIQRFSTERILRSLQKHSAQTVEVRRDNKRIHVDATELVPGDVIILREGDKIPADARIIAGSNIRTDESLLTGESVPIAKQLDSIKGEKEIYEQSNILFQGAFIVSGEVEAVVYATGNATEFGQLAALTSNQTTESPVQQKINKLLNQIIAVVGGMAIVAFVLSLVRGTEITEAIRFVMALSVSAVPESLPVAISVILVLGMRRMAKKKALVRSMRAIETIGVITTIATDKTGTLTKNKLTVQEVWQPADIKHHLPTFARHSINHSDSNVHDPLDIAMIEYADAEKAITLKGTLLHSLPFSQEHAMSGNVWHHGSTYSLTIKGAPEHVIARAALTEDEREDAEVALHRLTAQGYRVIALATTDIDQPVTAFSKLHKTARFEFVGFVAVADILRPEARRAVSAALSACVTVRMITGDHFETAYHIARQLGMATSREQIFDARRMSVMTDDELSEIIDSIRVFSRVIPEHKHRILSLLKTRNITAMTGDGVNDVPALANAHVGVAMGSGSHIAKDAGDIILLDDNFKSIIDAMKEGRTIVANIRRMLSYLLATNAGEALTMLGALVIGMPVPLVPVQILWINLVTDTSMVIPLGLEPGERDVMKHPPKSPHAPILNMYRISRMIIIALSMAATALGLYALFASKYGHDYGMTIAFCALVVMQWANAFNARSDYESLMSRIRVWNGKFYAGLSIAVTLQLLALFGPLQGLLHITPVALGDLFITGLFAFIMPIVIVEIHKYFGRKYRQNKTSHS